MNEGHEDFKFEPSWNVTSLSLFLLLEKEGTEERERGSEREGDRKQGSWKRKWRELEMGYLVEVVIL